MAKENMAKEELQVIELRDAFYRDSFAEVVLVIICIFIMIVILICMSVYLFLNKPPPVVFPVATEFRVLPPVPLDQPYLSEADMLQWTSNAIREAFVFDYNHYNKQLGAASKYFTTDGWKIFLNQLNTYANYNNVQSNRLFVNAYPLGAPFITREGLLVGQYGWWVQMPVRISYAGFNPPPNRNLTLQILVARVSTLNNLDGVGINDIRVIPGTGNQQV